MAKAILCVAAATLGCMLGVCVTCLLAAGDDFYYDTEEA